MKRALLAPAACLILAALAIAQDLPSDVLLLSRVRRHTKEGLQQLPNVSCLETVYREHQSAKGRMQPLDTVRLEVLTNGGKELFASPGDRSFSERPPISYVGSGALGDGYFGLYLKTLLVENSTAYTFKGEEEIAGRRLSRWDYTLPLMWSGQTFQLPEGSGKVSLNGSFWADPGTSEVTRLAVNAGDFPPSLPVTDARWSIEYAQTGLGGNLVALIPQSAEFRMAKFSGEISHNRIEFTQCHAFGADATINFDATESQAAPARFGVSTIDDTLRPLPGGLQIPVKLRSRITGDMAVGALIDGEIAANVGVKGMTAIASGSPVRGRIRRLERYSDPLPHFVVALEFSEVESRGIRYRFDADLVRIDPAIGVEQTLSTPGVMGVPVNLGRFEQMTFTKETLFFTNLPGVATFFLRGATLNVPQGLRTVWATRP